jgi:pimeloyl-ACP methyl ester carboxylesterase
MTARPFEIHVSQATLDELSWRLRHTRWPATSTALTGTWDDGADLTYLRELCEYWVAEYDWKAVDRRLNALPQFQMEVDDLDVHFVHLTSPPRPRVPLLMLHGWPGSVFEYLEPAQLLAADDEAGKGFDVVVASLPGFGFGGQPTVPGWGVSRMAGALDKLMQGLGYAAYGVVGTDWGGAVAGHLGATYRQRCRAVYTTPHFAPAPRTPGGEAPQWITEFRTLMKDRLGYAQIQRTRPDSLALAQNDSPAGVAAWIVEKFHAWGDTGGRVESVFSKDALITSVMFYWAPGSVASSARIYREMARDRAALSYPRVEVPTAIAALPADPFKLPREVVELRYRVVRWTEFERGGHFPALEVPEAFAEDVRSFFTDQLAR